jgi:transaldolase
MTNLHHLYKPLGQSPWIDNLSRDLINSGALHAYVEKGIRGLTSNPTILEHAILSSSLYDEQIKRLSYEGLSTEDIYWKIVIDDIRSAAAILQPVFDASNGEDGFVSLEVSPTLAHDAEKTLEQARYLWKEVGVPNLMIKVPATDECIPVIQTLLSEGIHVNVTLIFSLSDYKKVAQAHVGTHLLSETNPARSVASFFISRVDTEVDARLEAIGTPEAKALQGKIAIAQARLAYDIFLDAFSKRLALEGHTSLVQRLLWASTSSKNPAYDDLMYVTNLIAPFTVNTLPEATIEHIVDHLPDDAASFTLIDLEEALETIQAVRAVGVDMEDVISVLETQGIEKFQKSFATLLDAIESKR